MVDGVESIGKSIHLIPFDPSSKISHYASFCTCSCPPATKAHKTTWQYQGNIHIGTRKPTMRRKNTPAAALRLQWKKNKVSHIAVSQRKSGFTRNWNSGTKTCTFLQFHHIPLAMISFCRRHVITGLRSPLKSVRCCVYHEGTSTYVSNRHFFQFEPKFPHKCQVWSEMSFEPAYVMIFQL